MMRVSRNMNPKAKDMVVVEDRNKNGASGVMGRVEFELMGWARVRV